MTFAFPHPAEGRLAGPVGFNGEGFYQAQLLRIQPGPTVWRMEKREIVWKQAEHPGHFFRCVPSPRGDRLAWLNSFSESYAKAILVSDADGGNACIAYEHLYSFYDREKGSAESPWFRSLEWTPRGDSLAFWRGEGGKNGLCLLPAPEVTAKAPRDKNRAG